MKKKITLLLSICTFYLSAQSLILDNSYGTNGISIFTNETKRGTVKSLIQPDGKTIVTGERINGTNLNETFIARLNENGTNDIAFGNNGFFTSYQDPNNVGTPNLFMIGNKILLYYPLRRQIIKLNSNGTFDNTFGINGISTIISNAGASPESVAILDNYLYLRSTNSNTNSNNILQKVDLITGSVISTTNVLGINNINDVYNGFNNKLLLKSFDGQNCHLFLVNTDGTFDTSFGNNGSIIVSSHNSIVSYESTEEYVTIDGDNNLIHTLIDYPTAITTVKKYNANGSLITTFANAGSLQISNAIIFDVKIFSNEIYLGGANFINGSYNLLLTKLTSNGILDTSFNNNGTYIYNNNSYQEALSSFNIISPTSLLVAGQMLINSPDKNIFTAKFILEPNLSITRTNSKNSIFFENPINSNLVWNLTEEVNNIELFSISGQLIKTIKQNNENISELKSGIYLAKIELKNGKFTTEKLIKN